LWLCGGAAFGETLERAKGLLASARPEDHAHAASICGKLGPQAAPLAALLVSKLRTRTPWVREEILKSLGAIGPGAFASVTPLLQWTQADVRTGAADLFVGYAGSMERIDGQAEPLVNALLHVDMNVRAAMARVLPKCGPECVPLLLRRAGSDDPLVRDTVARVLAIHGAEAPALKLASASAWTERETAARLLGRLARAEGAATLIVLLTDEAAEVREQAALGLARLREKGEEVLHALARGFQDPSPAVRLACADAVASFGEPVRQRVIDDTSLPRGCAARVLARLGDSEARISWELLRQPTGTDREVAAALVGTPSAGPLVEGQLRQRLGDANPELAAAAAAALTSYGVNMDEALEVLLRTAGSEAGASALAGHGVAARAAAPQLLANLRNGPIPLQRATVRALGAIRNDRAPDLRGAWESLAVLPPEVAAALRSAVAWLVETQAESGGWSSEEQGGDPAYNRGLSALALLALRAAGPASSDAQRKARQYLLASQDAQGWLAPPIPSRHCQHSIATWALAESAAFCRDRALLNALSRATAALESARNAFLGWRYFPKEGYNDTHETAWATGALQMAKRVGVSIDPRSEAGARDWFDKMTDPEFGQVGYNMPGGQNARPFSTAGGVVTEAVGSTLLRTQTMTSACLWSDALLGGVFDSQLRDKARNLVLNVIPSWNSGSGELDFCYWHWGSLALAPIAKSADAKEWQKTLRGMLVARQSPDGSWDPVDAWGPLGGRIYSTAMGVLALVGPDRYPAEFVNPALTPAWRTPIDEALRKASTHKDAAIRYAALRGLAGLPPFEG